MFTNVLATGSVNDGHHIYTRLTSDGGRLGLMVVVFVVIYLVAIKFAFKNKFVALIPAFGAAWFSWYAYNAWNDLKTPIIAGKHSPTQLWDFVFRNEASFYVSLLAFIVAVVIAGVILRNDKVKGGFLFAIFVGLSVWFGAILLYTLVFVPIVQTRGGG